MLVLTQSAGKNQKATTKVGQKGAEPDRTMPCGESKQQQFLFECRSGNAQKSDHEALGQSVMRRRIVHDATSSSTTIS